MAYGFKILNAVNAFFALAVSATSMYFFSYILYLTSLRNPNYYALNYNVYWPQLLPWLFFFIGILVFSVCLCGFFGDHKKSKTLLKIFCIGMGFSVILLITLAAVSCFLGLAERKGSKDFIEETVLDVFGEAKTHPEVEVKFNRIEKVMQCCGAKEPRDYKLWRNEFPRSCCEQYHYFWTEDYIINCEFHSTQANARYGCAVVIYEHTKIIIIALSVICVFIAFLGVISIAVAFFRLKKKTRPVYAPAPTTEMKSMIK